MRDYKKLRHYLPPEIRKQNYEIIKSRIFGEIERSNEENLEDNLVAQNIKQVPARKSPSRKILKLRKQHKERKRVCRNVAEAIGKFGRSNGDDSRPYADFKIGDVRFRGLLDSGATISILGKGCREMIDNLGLEINKIFSNVRTASGQKFRIIGNIEMDVEYKNKVQKVLFYLCPDLDQAVYL